MDGFATPPKNVRDIEDFRKDFTFHEGSVQSMRKSFYNVRMRRSRAIILDFMGFTGDFKISLDFGRFRDFT